MRVPAPPAELLQLTRSLEASSSFSTNVSAPGGEIFRGNLVGCECFTLFGLALVSRFGEPAPLARGAFFSSELAASPLYPLRESALPAALGLFVKC